MSTLRPASILTILILAAAPLLAQEPAAPQVIGPTPASSAQAQAEGETPVQTRAQARDDHPAPAQGQAQEPAQGQEPGPYSDQIIWSPRNQTVALFVPQEVLDTTPLEELPVDELALERMRGAIDVAERKPGESRRSVCWHAKHERWPLSENGRKSIEELIEAESLAFVGTVEDTVPGWSNWVFKPVTALYLRVDEILKNQDNFLQLGQVVAQTELQATINLYGVEACSTYPDDFWEPHRGDHLLFSGLRYEEGSARHPYFVNGLIFLVRGEQIVPQPMDGLRNTRPRSLDSIRVLLQTQDQQ